MLDIWWLQGHLHSSPLVPLVPLVPLATSMTLMPPGCVGHQVTLHSGQQIPLAINLQQPDISDHCRETHLKDTSTQNKTTELPTGKATSIIYLPSWEEIEP